MKRVLAIAISTLMFGCVVHTAPPGAEGLEQWNVTYPDAARDLCVWAHTHPDASLRFFRWDGQYNGKVVELVSWTLANPGRGIDGFVSTHPNWTGFDFMAENHRRAANGLMGWIRQHPEAAQRLAVHPHGLEWGAAHGGC